MFQNRNTTRPISHKQTEKWLSWLAQQMIEASQTVFFIEQLQPSWLLYKIQKILYRIVSGLIGGLIVGLSVSLIFGVITYPTGGLAFGLMIGPGAGLFISRLGDIKTFETLKWSFQELKKMFSSKQFWLSLLFLPGAAYFLLPIFVLIFGLKGPALQKRNYPNQGILRTARNAIILGSINGLIFFLVFGFFGGLMGGLIFFLAFGLFGGLVGGGTACIRHLTLRIFCYLSGYIPWNYAHFLNHATELIFMQKVGGGYIFIHRMLMEHFAQMKVD